MYKKWADICAYELPTNLQNFMQKDLTEVKIFQEVLWGLVFLKHPVVSSPHGSPIILVL